MNNQHGISSRTVSIITFISSIHTIQCIQYHSLLISIQCYPFTIQCYSIFITASLKCSFRGFKMSIWHLRDFPLSGAVPALLVSRAVCLKYSEVESEVLNQRLPPVSWCFLKTTKLVKRVEKTRKSREYLVK